jgi:hypothetical protein
MSEAGRAHRSRGSKYTVEGFANPTLSEPASFTVSAEATHVGVLTMEVEGPSDVP